MIDVGTNAYSIRNRTCGEHQPTRQNVEGHMYSACFPVANKSMENRLYGAELDVSILRYRNSDRHLHGGMAGHVKPLLNVSLTKPWFQCEQETMEGHGAQEKQKVGSMNDKSNDEQIDSHDFMPEQKPNVVPLSWKPFGCETCGKRFTLRGSLKTHEKLHGFRPTYNCDVCGKTFKVATGLKSHASLHSGQKPFHCDICGKSFTLKGSLKTHSALHSTVRESFPCYMCGKTYKGRASLKSHYAMHADKKSFMCE